VLGGKGIQVGIDGVKQIEGDAQSKGILEHEHQRSPQAVEKPQMNHIQRTTEQARHESEGKQDQDEGESKRHRLDGNTCQGPPGSAGHNSEKNTLGQVPPLVAKPNGYNPREHRCQLPDESLAVPQHQPSQDNQ